MGARYAWTWRKGSESLVEDIMVVGARRRGQSGMFGNCRDGAGYSMYQRYEYSSIIVWNETF